MPDWTQLYSNYDKTFVDWIRTVRYKDKPILSVFASPERAFGQIEKVVRERQGDTPKVIPLPFVSISRILHALDSTRYVRVPYLNRFRHPTDPDNKFMGTDRPQPMNLTYQVDFWSRNLSDLDNLMVQLIQKLRFNEIFLSVDLTEPFHHQLARTRLDGIAEAGDRLAGPRQRVLRRILTFVIEGWVFYIPTEYGRVKTIITEIWDWPDETELYDTVTVTGEEES